MWYKQTSHLRSSQCWKRMKSLLVSSRQLHMLHLSKNNGFLEREFWQAFHFYRFVAPPCHQTGHQFLTLTPTKTTKRRQTHTGTLRPTSNLKFLCLKMCCYVVSKKHQPEEARGHFQHLLWSWKMIMLSFFSPFIVKCTECVKYVLYYINA